MREEVFEESVRLEIEAQAQEKFGMNYGDLPPELRDELRAAVFEQFYGKDAPPVVTAETGEEA